VVKDIVISTIIMPYQDVFASQYAEFLQLSCYFLRSFADGAVSQFQEISGISKEIYVSIKYTCNSTNVLYLVIYHIPNNFHQKCLKFSRYSKLFQ
jgi:hypothetical protein